MLIVGSCVAGDGSRFAAVAAPSLRRHLDPTDLILTLPGDERGIANVYNDFIATARDTAACEALVLVHDDVEIRDEEFRSKVLAAAAEPDVGIIGVVGGAGLRSGDWWSARRTAGTVAETRYVVNAGEPDADVDSLDGLLLILTPAAFGTLRFDAAVCPRFHGYDVDICLQARRRGLRVVVRPFDLFHHTKGGFGDEPAFDAAARALRAKYPDYIVGPDLRDRLTRVRVSIRYRSRRLVRSLRGDR